MDILFCKTLPKIELHAHLNGSLSEKTIQALCHLKDAPHLYDNWQVAINHGEHRTLSECFDMFKAVHALTTCPIAISLATAHVLQEFEDDGVVYLELRSTPREVPGKMTKEEYVEAIIQSILAHQGKMKVKLLLSIDRRQGVLEADHTLQLACQARECHPTLIAGLDLSGDPTAGAFELFLPTLNAARAAGLGVAVHYAEVANEEETTAILKFCPDRLGHATCVHPELGGSQEQWDSLIKSRIPVEVCLTSNVRSKTVPSYDKHHFQYLYAAKHPIVLSTDDKGVFCSDLSHEYILTAETFGLTKEQLLNLSSQSVDFCLASPEEKSELRKLFV